MRSQNGETTQNRPTVTFKYDPFGRRIYKSSSAATSIFAYDGDDLIEETNGTGAVVARYSQGQNIDEPLAMSRSSATSYYEADGLGSVTSLSNGAGSLVQTYTFDSFGKQTGSSGSLTNPFQYTARELDPETGLYYYRARYYDPNIGRFTSEDSIGFGDGPNLYAFVGNSPTVRVDPFGHQSVCWDKMQVTSALGCKIEYVSAQGMGNTCAQKAPGKVAKLCEELMKKIQKKKPLDLPPAICPPGRTCTDKKPIEIWQPVNEQVTLSVPAEVMGVQVGTCNVTVKVTGSFVGKGSMGVCKGGGGGGC